MSSSKEFYKEGSTENISEIVKETETRSFQFSSDTYKQTNLIQKNWPNSGTVHNQEWKTKQPWLNVNWITILKPWVSNTTKLKKNLKNNRP